MPRVRPRILFCHARQVVLSNIASFAEIIWLILRKFAENSNEKDGKRHVSLYNYEVYSRTTKRYIVVRLKGDATRLSRRTDCSQQTCRLGSARLLSLVTTFKKILP